MKDDIVTVVAYRNTPAERDTVLRLIANQPDADLLAEIMGLVDTPVVAKPPAKWCGRHLIPRRIESSGYRRCPECRREANRRSYEKARKA